MIDYEQLEFYLNSREFNSRFVDPILEEKDNYESLNSQYLISADFVTDFNCLTSFVKKRGSMSNFRGDVIDPEFIKNIELFERIYEALELYKINNDLIRQRSNENGIYHWFVHYNLRFEKSMKANSANHKVMFKKVTYIG